MSKEKHVVIQKRINEVMIEEFEKMLKEYSQDPLLQLIMDGKISISLEHIKKYLKEFEN